MKKIAELKVNFYDDGSSYIESKWRNKKGRFRARLICNAINEFINNENSYPDLFKKVIERLDAEDEKI